MLSSVANALRVLEFIVDRGEVGISQIGRGLEMNVGTTYRLVATLVAAGFVAQNPANRRYGPGPKISELARKIHSPGDFTAHAHEHLERLMAQAGETVNLAVLRRGEVVYIDRAVTSQVLAVAVRVGSHVPAYCTSLGRAILAFSEPKVFEDYLEHLDEHADGREQPAPTPAELRRIIERARERGYAEDNGEYAADIACVAAPILDSRGQAAAAISVAGPLTRIESRREELAAMVQITAKELSELLLTLGGGIDS